MRDTKRLMLLTCWWRSQFGDGPQDVGKEVSWDRYFRHLEGDIAVVADALRADLD